MTLDELRKKIRDGAYNVPYKKPPSPLPKDHVQDENQSVVWNRECVRLYNQGRSDIIAENRKAENEAHRRFTSDLVDAIIQEYKLTPGQAYIVEAKAYEDGHSAGYDEVITYAKDLCEFWEEMSKAAK